MALSKKAAQEFARYWAGRGDEKGETQQFWIDLLQNVLGDEDALRHLRFEARVDTEAGVSKGFADVAVMRPDGRGMLALIEQKSAGIDLGTPDAARDPFDVLDGPFRDFPYMNGGLFAEKVQIPTIDETLRTELIIHGCQEFDWSGVSMVMQGER